MTTPITRILVPTDFSDTADAALTYALSLADQVGAVVRLVHAFEEPDAVSLYSHAYVPMPAEMRAEILADIQRQLTARTAPSGHKNVTTEILTGPAAKTIVDCAIEQQSDLIVMGTHGRHGVAHLLMGSVAERVLRTSACPVLVVPPFASR